MTGCIEGWQPRRFEGPEHHVVDRIDIGIETDIVELRITPDIGPELGRQQVARAVDLRGPRRYAPARGIGDEIVEQARIGIEPSLNALSALMFIALLILLIIVNRRTAEN